VAEVKIESFDKFLKAPNLRELARIGGMPEGGVIACELGAYQGRMHWKTYSNDTATMARYVVSGFGIRAQAASEFVATRPNVSMDVVRSEFPDLSFLPPDRMESMVRDARKSDRLQVGYEIWDCLAEELRELRNWPLPESPKTFVSEAPLAARVPSKEAQMELGRWAELRLQEARQFVRLLRGGKTPESFRPQFVALFAEVIDELQEARRKRLFQEAKGRLMGVPDLMDYIADVKQLSGATLANYRKIYRHETGTARKDRPARAQHA
jgi:hypothetical protein